MLSSHFIAVVLKGLFTNFKINDLHHFQRYDFQNTFLSLDEGRNWRNSACGILYTHLKLSLTRRFVAVETVQNYSEQYFVTASLDSSVCLASGLRVERSRSRGSSVVRGKKLFSITCRPALGPTEPPIQWVPAAIFLAVRRLECEANYSIASSAGLWRRNKFLAPTWNWTSAVQPVVHHYTYWAILARVLCLVLPVMFSFSNYIYIYMLGLWFHRCMAHLVVTVH
jgi:hypothetical protein